MERVQFTKDTKVIEKDCKEKSVVRTNDYRMVERLNQKPEQEIEKGHTDFPEIYAHRRVCEFGSQSALVAVASRFPES